MEPTEQPSRSLDALSMAAAVCVALLIAGEVVLLVWIFQTHRSRRMRVHATEVVEVTLPNVTNATTVVSDSPPSTASVIAVSATAAASQPVLNPALKIQRLHRDGALLQVRLRAQTGEPAFVSAAAGISVEWHLADGSTRLEWIAVPAAWENFAVQTLAARYDGAAAVRGCVVRTYYRHQLQDQAVEGETNP